VEATFLAALPAIDRIIAILGRRYGLADGDLEDFSSWAKARLIESDYAVFRKFGGRSMAGVLVAHALWRGSWRALLPVAGFVAYIDRVQVAAEERALHERFGAEYDAYVAAVPRWLDRRSVQRR
jgi:hypothetical protein